MTLRAPIPPYLEHSPELASLAILDAALLACEYAILASCPEIHHGALEDAARGSTTLRGHALILQARRLAAAISAYRDAVDRDARRADRQLRLLPL
jgi:hypothetical protein